MASPPGVSSETSFIGNYAYRMNTGNGKLAFGLGLGMILNKTDWNSLAAQDEDDEVLSENSSTHVMPDFSFGVYYRTKKYFVGFSMPLFLSHEYNSKTDKYATKNKIAPSANTAWLPTNGTPKKTLAIK